MNTRTTAALAALIAGVSAAALALTVVAILGWEDQNGTFLMALVGLAVASEMADFSPFPNSRESMSMGLIFAAAILGGISSVVVVSLAVALADQVLHRVAVHKAIYNGGLLIISGATCAGTVSLLSNVPEDGLPKALAPVMLGAILAYAVNAGLLALAISLETGRRAWAIFGADFAWMLPHYSILGAFGLLMAMAYDRWELAGVALLLAPLSVHWLAIKYHTGRMIEHAAPAA